MAPEPFLFESMHHWSRISTEVVINDAYSQIYLHWFKLPLGLFQKVCSKCCNIDITTTLNILASKNLHTAQTKKAYFVEKQVEIPDFLTSLKCSITPVWLEQPQVLRLNLRLWWAACHSVTGVITYPNGRWKKGGKSLIGRDTAQQLRGRPVRRQNKSTLSLWFCPCASSLSSPVVVVVDVVNVVVVVIIDLEFDLNTSYLNYLVLWPHVACVFLIFPFVSRVHFCCVHECMLKRCIARHDEAMCTQKN